MFEDAYNYMKSGTLLRQVANKLGEIDFTASDDRHVFNDVYETILKDLQSAGNAGEYYTPRAVTRFMAERVDPELGEVVFDPACGTGGFLVDAIEHLRRKGINSVAERDQLQRRSGAIEKKPLPHLLCTTNLVLHDIEVPDVRHDNSLARPLASYGPADRVDVVLTNPPFGGVEEDGIENNFPLEFRTRETADLFMALILRRAEGRGTGGRRAPGRVPVRGGRQDAAEGAAPRRVRPPHRRPAPERRVRAVHDDQHEPPLLREGAARRRRSGSSSTRSRRGTRTTRRRSRSASRSSSTSTDWWDDREETEWAWKVPIEEIEERGLQPRHLEPHHEEKSGQEDGGRSARRPAPSNSVR